jgi:hypothetical protein
VNSTARLVRACLAALIALSMTAGAAFAGSESGEVVFRLTLDGDVNPDDGFLIDVRCDGGEFCNGVNNARTLYFCAAPILVDTVLCEAKTYEFTVAIPPQAMTYTLYRVPNVADPGHEPIPLLSGAWQVHGGSQTISLGYVYPAGDGEGSPLLPNTAMPIGG